MNVGLVGQAVGMFAVTNIDDIVILALFFSQTKNRTAAFKVVLGQYLGFAAILVASVLGALGAGLLPPPTIPYLGLLPLALGLRAAWTTWRDRHNHPNPADTPNSPTIWQVAAVTLANGGDNIGVYVPVFAVAGVSGMVVFVLVFLVGVALWCAAGHYFATRPAVAKALSRWGHVVLPLVLIAIGLLILIEGDAFGL
jgi:cadmium resistance protein CadD (predicted permease)